ITQLEEYLRMQKPPKFSTKYVEQAADKILVSFKAGKKVATITKYKATGKNKETGVIVPRGALHEQNVYGKIKVIEKDKPLKYLFENPDKIVDSKIKSLVIERLSENENNSKFALATLKKNPIFINNEKTEYLDKASCYEYLTVRKYPLNTINAKQADDIVDKKIKE